MSELGSYPIPMNRHHHVRHDIEGDFYECIDCLDLWFDWSDPNLHYTECPGEATPVKQAIHDATIGLPESVKKRMALALGLTESGEVPVSVGGEDRP